MLILFGQLFLWVVLGGIIIGLVTEYYTAGKPIRDIAEAGEDWSSYGHD